MFLDDYIGNTPLVTLRRPGCINGNLIWIKLEGNNPAGLVKNRAAPMMIDKAEKRDDEPVLVAENNPHARWRRHVMACPIQ